MTAEEKCDVIIAMLDEQKASGKNQKSQQLDFSKIELLSDRMEGMIEEVRQPIVSERRFTINIASKGTLFTFIGMVVIISGLSAWLYLATRPNYARIDNDLKYRYIKMKGEATPARLAELEELFEINRNEAKIGGMRQDVETYERTIRERTALEEQTRLQQIETEKLNNKAQSLRERTAPLSIEAP